MSNLPALPPIEGELLLDVFTRQSHRDTSSSSDDSENGGVERLAELGHTVLVDLPEKHKELMDDAHISQWLNCYNLKARVRGPRSTLDEPEEERLLFSSYVGAVYLQKGLPPLLSWISRLVDPESDPPPYQYPSTNAPTPPSVAPALVAPPPVAPSPALPPPQSGGLPQVNALALFNQTCSQRNLIVNWESVSEGPPHQPRWAVKCFVNNQLKGSGMGRNQKVAKEEAARKAFHAMGWGSFQ